MHRTRLKKLAALLIEDACNPKGSYFDMEFWGRVPEQNRGSRNVLKCGTAGCAWGTAAMSGVFKKDGVRFAVAEDSSRVVSIRYKGAEDFYAAVKFFNLPEVVANWLFMPEYYPSNMRAEAAAELLCATRVLRYVSGMVSLKTIKAECSDVMNANHVERQWQRAGLLNALEGREGEAL